MTDMHDNPGFFAATKEYHRDLEDPARLDNWARTSRLTDAMYAQERADREAAGAPTP